MKPHKHAEVIHAFADGAKLQVRLCGAEHWQETRFPDFADECEYRIKPEPAAPKWPQTKMTDKEINAAFIIGEFELVAHGVTERARKVADAALTHACEKGQVVTADKVREIAAKAYDAGSKAREYYGFSNAIRCTLKHLNFSLTASEWTKIIEEAKK